MEEDTNSSEISNGDAKITDEATSAAKTTTTDSTTATTSNTSESETTSSDKTKSDNFDSSSTNNKKPDKKVNNKVQIKTERNYKNPIVFPSALLQMLDQDVTIFYWSSCGAHTCMLDE